MGEARDYLRDKKGEIRQRGGMLFTELRMGDG